MLSLSIILGVLTVVLDTITRGFYVRDVLRGRVKPHAFTWFIWFVLMMIGGAISMSQGAWVAGTTLLFSAVQNSGVFALSLRFGEKQISSFDKTSFALILTVIPVWLLTKNALVAAILVSCIDGAGYFYTFKKVLSHPDEESAGAFSVFALTEVLRLSATVPFSLTATLYPFVIFAMNCSLVATILVCRKRRQTIAKE